MKREGRQHGMVRVYAVWPHPWNPPPTADLFTKVPSKPTTNHSKFTGKCGAPRCHPVCKSMDKIKGTHKMRSPSNFVSDNRLITWRVVDEGADLKFSGLSATAMLDYLASDNFVDCDREDFDYDYAQEEILPLFPDNTEVEEFGIDDYVNIDDDVDDRISFCEVDCVWEPADHGDETWCLVEEMSPKDLCS